MNITIHISAEDLKKKMNIKDGKDGRSMVPRSSQSPLFYDLSSQTNGVTKVFSVPKNLGGIIVGSDFPTVLMERNGFTVNAPRTQLTLTVANAPTQGSQLVFIGKNVFNAK